MIQNAMLLVTVVCFFCGSSSAQDDTTRARWFREYYTKYVKEAFLDRRSNYMPPKGVVPDSATAIKVAEVILSEAYGKRLIEGEKPLTALLVDGYWIVYGHLSGEFLAGGVAEIIIRKANGEVMRISHGK